MPITDFLSYTQVLDKIESFSSPQRHHAKTYIGGLAAVRNKTVTGISREVLPANNDRALNNYLTEYHWDKNQFNDERLHGPQKHGESHWSQDV